MNSLDFVKIAWFGKHFGEEPPFTGSGGAGTIFFTGCSLHCVYCQNFQISQQRIGKNYSIEELAEIMLKLQKDDAINIDLVSPMIWYGQIKSAIINAKEKGLNIPIIWNSNGFDGADIIAEMSDFVDIFLPDFKYGKDELALKYSGVKNYVGKAKETIQEMFKRAGNLKLADDGLAKKGIVVRHLILPNNIENSLMVLRHIHEIDKDIYISLMTQYEPVFKAKDYPEINRRITKEEFETVHNYQMELGLLNGWVQEMESQETFLPDFTKENPFG